MRKTLKSLWKVFKEAAHEYPKLMQKRKRSRKKLKNSKIKKKLKTAEEDPTTTPTPASTSTNAKYNLSKQNMLEDILNRYQQEYNRKIEELGAEQGRQAVEQDIIARFSQTNPDFGIGLLSECIETFQPKQHLKPPLIDKKIKIEDGASPTKN